MSLIIKINNHKIVIKNKHRLLFTLIVSVKTDVPRHRLRNHRQFQEEEHRLYEDMFASVCVYMCVYVCMWCVCVCGVCVCVYVCMCVCVLN